MSFYSKIRHPQYLFHAISGFGLLLVEVRDDNGNLAEKQDIFRIGLKRAPVLIVDIDSEEKKFCRSLKLQELINGASCQCQRFSQKKLVAYGGDSIIVQTTFRSCLLVCFSWQITLRIFDFLFIQKPPYHTGQIICSYGL